MAFDPLSWAIGFTLTRAAGRLLKKSEAKAFADSLRKAVLKWSRGLPQELSDLHPDAVVKRLFEADCEQLGPKRQHLQECFEGEIIPEEDVWFEAISERREEVYSEVGDDAQRFFKVDPAVAESHIRTLAEALHRECVKNDEFFKVTLFAMIKELVERDRQREAPLPRQPRPGERISPADFLQPYIWRVPETASPAMLLNARYGVVTFFNEARTTELDDLRVWCDDSEVTTGVRLFYGPGGTGKTRLFIEWANHLRKKRWYAGFLPERVDEEQIESLVQTDKPALVVLDYAECRAGLFEFLKRIAGRPAEQTQRLRVVLLARDVADWWQSLLQRDEAVRHLLVQAEPTLIAPVTPEGDLRKRIWEHARDAFVAHLQKAVPSRVPDLEDPRFGRILYLHMSALAAVEGLGTKVESLLEEIVVHEKHFWTKHYQEQFGKDGFEAADFDKRCSRLVAAVTLHGGVPSREAAEELNRRIEGPAARYKHLVPFLRSLYPGRGRASHDRYLGGLEPDLLGEALVWSVLTDPENTADTFLERVFAGAPEIALGNGFVVLGRISLQDPTVASPWLAGVLEADIPGRARPAFQAALALGSYTAHSPLGLILANALERKGTLDHATKFDSLVPHQTVSLREMGVWTGRRLLEFLSTQEDTQKNLTGRARLLNNLGNRLSALGRREEALQAAQEALDIYRRLAKDRSDAFLPDLAGSLNNLGARLSALGRREKA